MKNKASFLLKKSLSLFFYIVLFLSCFNISRLQAGNITTDFPKTDEPQLSDSASEAPLSIAPAFQLRTLLEQNKVSSISNILLIGQYFDSKYPAEKINADFEDDVRQLFPKLTNRQIYDYTSNIRFAIKIYRWAKNKYNEIKQQLLAPKEPPLIVDEKDYDLPTNAPYIETKEGQFAIIYDFKKVLSYSSDPKEIEAYKAYYERQTEKKKHKTDFDKFKLMFSKIEFSKLFQYGVTIPNPFVGNAGSGRWEETANGFKAKLISSVSEIHQTQEILAALYLLVPSHRIMAATTLYGKTVQPEIKLTDLQNIRSYEIFRPMPVTLINKYMVGAYAGDFAFPIKLSLTDPDKPVSFKAEISFDDCDDQLLCQHETLSPKLFINSADEESVSSMRNFITQSYTHLPQKTHQNIKLEDFSVQVDPDQNTIRRINLVFDFKGSFNAFSFFLSAPENVIFLAPQYIVLGHKIYVSVSPAPDSAALRTNDPALSYTAQLNIFDKIFGTINLDQHVSAQEKISLFYIAFLSFLTGLLFVFSPVGFSIFALWAQRIGKQSAHLKQRMLEACPLFAVIIISAIWTIIKYGSVANVWTAQFSNGALIFTATASVLFYRLYTQTKLSFFSPYTYVRALCFALLLILSLIFSNTWLINRLILSLDGFSAHLTAALFICPGLTLPYILYRPCKNPKISQLICLSGLFISKLFIFYLIILFFLQTSASAFFSIMIRAAVFYLMLLFTFRYLKAVRKLKIRIKDKRTAESMILCILFVVLMICAKSSSGILSEEFSRLHGTQSLSEVEQSGQQDQVILKDSNQIEQLLQSGDNVLLSVFADWCLTCRMNRLTAFNPTELSRLLELYPLTYIPLDATKPTPEIVALLKKYKSNSLPLTVFFNPIVDQGIVFPSLIKDRELISLVKKYYL